VSGTFSAWYFEEHTAKRTSPALYLPHPPNSTKTKLRLNARQNVPLFHVPVVMTSLRCRFLAGLKETQLVFVSPRPVFSLRFVWMSVSAGSVVLWERGRETRVKMSRQVFHQLEILCTRVPRDPPDGRILSCLSRSCLLAVGCSWWSPWMERSV